MSCTCEMLLPGACSCSGLSLSRQPVELSSLVSIHTVNTYSEYLQLCSRPHVSESAHGKTESGRSLRNKSGSLIWGGNLTESKLVQGAMSTGWAGWGCQELHKATNASTSISWAHRPPRVHVSMHCFPPLEACSEGLPQDPFPHWEMQGLLGSVFPAFSPFLCFLNS